MTKIIEKLQKSDLLPKTVILLFLLLLPVAGFTAGVKYQRSKCEICPAKLQMQTGYKENNYVKNTDPDEGYPKEMITVDYPKPNDVITSPLTVKGKARGTWFFEGDFPITLYCGINTKLVQTYASTQGEWMTEDFVEFTSTFEFPKPCEDQGILELIKANPSDLRHLDESVFIPVNFE